MLNVHTFKGAENVTAPAVTLTSARQIAAGLSKRFPIVRIFRQAPDTRRSDQLASLVESIVHEV